MTVEVLPDAPAVARRGAAWLGAQARAAIAARGRFLLAVSGGSTPGPLLRALAAEELPWRYVEIFQVDERVAPPGHADRNLTGLKEAVRGTPMASATIHAMPVELPEIAVAAARYETVLQARAGTPAVLDVVHLGLGADGHTASLIPDDGVLQVAAADVAGAAAFGGWRRLTLTLPALNRARQILWVVTGAEKSAALARLRAGDRGIPAGRVQSSAALVLADRAAAQG